MDWSGYESILPYSKISVLNDRNVLNRDGERMKQV